MPVIIADGFSSVFEHPSENLIMLVMVGGGLIVGFFAIIGAIWYQLRKSEIDAALKHEMIARGMSAEEIERVLAAKSGDAKQPAIKIDYKSGMSKPLD